MSDSGTNSDYEDLRNDDEPASKRKKRRFQKGWKAHFPWLEYNEELDSMFCKECVKQKKKSVFSTVNGCQNFRIDNLRKHGSSTEHIAAVESVIFTGQSRINCYQVVGSSTIARRGSSSGRHEECVLVS